MAKKPQPKPQQDQPDTRDLVRDAVAEIVYRTPMWAKLQGAVAAIVEDVSLGIAADAAAFFDASPGRLEGALKVLHEEAPGLWGAGIGHNQPPEPPTPEALRKTLEERYPELTKRRDALLAADKRFRESVPTIADDDTQGKAAEFVKQVNALDKVARAHHKAEKEPWIALGGVVQAFFAGIWEPIAASKVGIVAKMDVYARKKAQGSRDAATKVAADAAAEATAAAQRAAETMEPDDLAEAAGAAEAATQAAAHAAGPQADHSRTRGEFGAVSSLTVTWDIAVTDMAKLPDRFKLPDMAGLRLALRQAERDRSGTPIWDVAGTELLKNEATRVR